MKRNREGAPLQVPNGTIVPTPFVRVSNTLAEGKWRNDTAISADQLRGQYQGSGRMIAAEQSAAELEALALKVRGCRACAGKLPMEPRPVFQVSATARILVASQAPGTKVQATGVPFSDSSGDRLRQWMGVTPDIFYDGSRIAIVPMGFCYPGRGRGGDAPPRRECADLWRQGLLAQMPHLRLALLVGTYAQAEALGPGKMTDRVRNFRAYLPNSFPLPHPSWRSQLWAKKNPWFDSEVLPELRRQVRCVLAEGKRV